MEDETFYTIDEIAKKFKVTKVAVYKWMNTGLLDYVYIGGHRRITSTALLKFIRPGKESVTKVGGRRKKNADQKPTDVAA